MWPPPSRPLDDSSGRHARFDPSTEDVYTFPWPCAVTGHRAVLQPAQHLGGMADDVGVVPQVEGEEHRLAITPPEQRPDVRLECNPLGRFRERRRTRLIRWRRQGRHARPRRGIADPPPPRY